MSKPSVVVVVLAVLELFAGRTVTPQSLQSPTPPLQTVTTPSPATEQLSVEEAVQQALAQNLSYRSELERIGAAEGQLRQARLIPNPALSSSLATARPFGNEGEGAWSARIQQELETAGKRRYRTETVANDLERIRYETGAVERDLRARTRTAYFTLLQAQRDLELARETSSIVQRVVDLNAERVRVGEAAGIELNLARVELARSENNELEFERRLREAGTGLNLLTGRPAAAAVVATSDFSSPIASLPAESELIEGALSRRPEVLAADRNVDARRSALSLARALAVPNVTWGATYQRQNSIIGAGIADATGTPGQLLRRGQQLAFEASLPVPWFNRNQGNIATADYETRSAEEMARYVRNVVANEVTTALSNYRFRLRQRALYEASVLPQLQRNIETMQEAYRAGNENIFAVIQVQRTFFDTRQQYLQTLLNLEIDRIELEKAIGQTLR